MTRQPQTHPFSPRLASWLGPVLTALIAMVWFVNGLYCKLLEGVPRHEMIVARVLGEAYASGLTKAIGFSEMVLVAWYLSRIAPRLCAITQIVVVMLMNVIELTIAADLLLFGHYNIIWATMFCGLVYVNEFVVKSAVSRF